VPLSFAQVGLGGLERQGQQSDNGCDKTVHLDGKVRVFPFEAHGVAL